MTHRPVKTPCLGARVAALADGTMRPDVRDRALAHTLTCPTCRDAVDVERLTVERLRSLHDPDPSPGLLATLYAMGEPGDPVPPRRGVGPGMPRPLLVAVGPSGPPSMVAPVRPGGSTHPTNRSAGRRMRRSVVVVAAGALGMGAVTAGVLTSAVGLGAVGSPVAQLRVQSPTSAASAATGGQFGASSGRQSQSRSGSMFGRPSSATSALTTSALTTSAFTTSASSTSVFATPLNSPFSSPFSSPSFSTTALRMGGVEPVAHGHRLTH
ncbi:hypothetical protein ACPPVT_05530 [Angustibacter sp. McL0619]|uniref:hypothetical protein n=1 Tax=Angustibacter sp. McL0619 TaxID=3415676 RepID=UPI003CF9DFE1